MADAVKILAFSGSLRKASYNTMLVKIAAAGAEQAGASVTWLDLKAYPLPIYDQDVEDAGPPAHISTLRDLFRDHEGFLISSPEYNGGYSAALKNVIDWVSRPEEGRTRMEGFNGKVAGLMAAAAGGFGGMRALPSVRTILSGIGVLVLPTMVGIPAAHEAFDEAGRLKDEKKQAAAESIGATVAKTITKLRS